MQKSVYLFSHKHVPAKTVTSLQIQQNIDLSQCVTLKDVDFRYTVKYFDFTFTFDRKDVNFT